MDSASGARCLLVTTHPAGSVRGVLLHVHGFAEELNKSRRMVALAARRFAEQGWLSLQLDLAGCGDSSGDWQDFSWQDWLHDIDAGWAYARSECAGAPVVLWGLRGGALLASDWMASRASAAPLLLWQPVLNGQQHLTQFLRVRAAADMLDDQNVRADTTQLRAELAAGSVIDVAGYPLAAPLADGLSAARFSVAADYAQPALLLELSAQADEDKLSPALRQCLQRWPVSERAPQARAVSGPAFWNTVDITTAPALIEASADWLRDTWGDA